MVRFARPTRSGRNRPAKNKVKDGTRLGNVSSPLETICETLPHCQSAERVIEFGDGNERRCRTSDFRKTKSETTKAKRYVDILRVDWYSSQTYLGRRMKGARVKFSLTLIQVLGHPACQSACCSGSPCSAGVQGSPGPGDNIFDKLFATNPEDGFHGRLVKAGEGSPGVGRLELSRGDVGLLPCACLRIRAPAGNGCLFRLV